MNFLFSSTISLDGKKECVYKVYESRLVPGEYKAELVFPLDGYSIKQITFWIENGNCRTIRKSEEVKQLADILGQEIEKSKDNWENFKWATVLRKVNFHSQESTKPLRSEK